MTGISSPEQAVQPVTIFLVTPSFNAADTIDETIASVIEQKGDFHLRYHVQDGGSDDGTLERLAAWRTQIETGQARTGARSLTFTYESAPDNGLYDAIASGFAQFDLGADDWLGWINADDLLSYGALAYITAAAKSPDGHAIRWVTGQASVIRNDVIINQVSRPITAAALSRGLCDGRHWDFLRQEGTFFRGSLWQTIDVDKDFSSLRLAADWNLWRLFAKHEELYLAPVTLGSFRIRDGQLSSLHRDDYMREIASIVPEDERRAAFDALNGDQLTEYSLRVDAQSGHVSVKTRPLAMHLKYLRERRFDAVAQSAGLSEAALALGHFSPAGQSRQAGAFAAELMQKRVARRRQLAEGARHAGADDDCIIAHDDDWQYPAVTEEHAFRKIRERIKASDSAVYLAFPWATLFDKLNKSSESAAYLLSALNGLDIRKRSGNRRVITVCQHIQLKQFLHIFNQHGVTDVFWSHAEKGESTLGAGGKMRVYPFPLYPVQQTEADFSAWGAPRPHLFSFIGARADQWYMTKVRDWIIDQLHDDTRGVVRGRDSWHYGKVVYDHQIYGSAARDAPLIDNKASEEFRDVLKNSLFALCPSGSGPNSIRLWEALGAGAIPVILSDKYATPGLRPLWQDAAVFCDETPEAVAALPDQLAAMARDDDLIARKRHAMQQIWSLYGPDSFVYDVEKKFIEIRPPRATAPLPAQTYGRIAALLGSKIKAQPADYQRFLDVCTGAALTRPEQFAADYKESKALREACRLALDHGASPDSAARFQGALARVKAVKAKASSVAPQKRRIKATLFGRHANRTPMGYDPYKPYFRDDIVEQTTVEKSEMLVTGFDLDYREHKADLMRRLDPLHPARFVVISEEPLWDSVWALNVSARTYPLDASSSDVMVHAFNHQNSDIFEFETIPYFLTTTDHFLLRYARLFARNAALSADDWLQHWQRAPIDAAFYAEKRDDERYGVNLPKDDIIGLCPYRTALAGLCTQGTVLRVGKGWGEGPARQALADWHLDKLTNLDRRCRIVSAVENTHQNGYITEKMFDAFAVGAIPVYYAGPRHRITDIVAPDTFINVHGESAERAAERIQSFTPDRAFAEGYRAAQRALAERFGDPATLVRERQRVSGRVTKALRTLA